MASCNLINKSAILSKSYSSRIDSEYYQLHFIENEELLLEKAHFRIGQHYFVTDGEHGSAEYLSSGVKYLTAENVKNGFVDISNVRYVSEAVNKKNARASVNPGDVLISIKATLGQIALAEEWLPPCNMNRDVAIMKRLSEKISRNECGYLAVFLMTKYGDIQAQRGGSGGVQQMITLERLRQFVVPAFSEDFYARINDLLLMAYTCRNDSKTSYADAEKTLLSAIGLSGFTPSDSKYSIRTLSDSFRTSNRIDAEYYQQKYDDIENVVCLNETVFCRVNDGVFTPGNGDYKYIELSDIGASGNIMSCTVAPFDKLPSRARRMVKSGQVIVSSIEGSLSSCALIPNEYDGALCSTGFYIVEASAINPETLLILFKSAPIQSIMKKRCSGTILTAISKSELEKIPLPKTALPDQQKIATDVQESFALRRKSEQLLNLAKQAVEMAIEDNEDAATKWLGGYGH